MQSSKKKKKGMALIAYDQERSWERSGKYIVAVKLSFIQQILIKYLFCISHCSRQWQEQAKSLLKELTFLWAKINNKQYQMVINATEKNKACIPEKWWRKGFKREVIGWVKWCWEWHEAWQLTAGSIDTGQQFAQQVLLWWNRSLTVEV